MDIQPNMSISGDRNLQFREANVQGNLNIHQESHHYVTENAESLEVNLDGYASGTYYPPACSVQHLQQGLQQHFLIFHGGYELHLPSYIKHLASCIKQAQPAFKAKELRRGTGGNRSLQETLRELTDPTILLVEDLVPLDIVEDPIAIRELAKTTGHFVLCTTKVAQDKWGLPAHSFQSIWLEIPTQGLYDPQVLSSLLAARIDVENIAFDQTWDILDRDMTIVEASKSLGNPSRIAALVLMLSAESRPISKERFTDILRDASSSKEQFIAAWYHRSDEKQRFILLAATLFQGLDETQFFWLIDQIIEDRWKHRVGILKALDYCDLDDLRDICRFEQIPGEPSILNPQVEDLELAILSTSWQGYRRHILATVPIIVNAITGTIGEGNVKPALRLRRQMALSLSRIALLSADDILPALKRFAAERSIPLRRVAAQALAAWRNMGQLARMCEVLDTWLVDEKSTTYIRYTALMALAFAADEDVPNHLHPEILSRIRGCMADPAKSVKDFIKDLIPKLLRNHPLQVAPMMLEDVLRGRDTYNKRDLIEPVAQGLAHAVKDYPKVMVPFLDQYMVQAVQTRDASGIGRQHSHRDRKFVAILETYFFIDYEALRKYIDPAVVLQRLAAIRLNETQPFVRESLMKVILHLMQVAHTLDRNVWEQLLSNSIFEERVQLIRALGKLMSSQQITVAAPYFDLIVSDVSKADYSGRLDMLAVLVEIWPIHYKANPNECIHFIAIFLQFYRNSERIHFVRTLGEIYLNSRADLAGGDFTLKIGEKEIPIFLYRRPLTEVEQHMLDWLDSPIRQCRKTSLLTWMEFARILEIEEKEAIANWKPSVVEPEIEMGIDASEDDVTSQESTSTTANVPQLSPQYLGAAIPLIVRLIGCLCVLFAPKEERKRFWQAVQVIYGRPQNYQIGMVRHTIFRLQNSSQPTPQGLGRRLQILREWVSIFSSKM